MDNDGFSSADDNGDDVARLVALTERQHRLWNDLRDAKDEDVRNRLFDELSENREELAKLKEQVSADLDDPHPDSPAPVSESEQPRSVGETLRASLLTPTEGVAPPQPPPPPPPTTRPPVVDDVAEPEPDPEPIPIEPVDRSVDLDTEVAEPQQAQPPAPAPKPEGLTPEATPFSSREADLAATRGRRESSVVRRPLPEPEPRPVEDEVLERRRRHAHQAYRDIERVRPEHTKPFPIFAILTAVVAVAAVAWLLFFRPDSTAQTVAPTTSTTVASVATESRGGGQIRAGPD